MHKKLLATGTLTFGWILACGGGDAPPPADEEAGEQATEEGSDEAAGEAGPAGASGPDLDRIRARGTLVVGMDMGENGEGTPPMYFPDAAGKPDGFDYQVAKWVATTVGVPDVKLVHGDYAELPEMLRATKELDVVISGYAPVELPGITWSESYLDYGLCLVVKTDSPIHTVADLWGKPVGIFEDEAARHAVEGMVKGYSALTAMSDGYWDALYDGRFDGFIYDYPYAAAEIRQYTADHPDRKGAFRFAQYNLNDMSYTVAVREGEPDLLAAVNDGINRFYESDQYAAAVRQFLGGGTVAALPEAPAGSRTYVVKQGDTLSLIAQRELGSTDRWKEIWKLNSSRVPNPNLIEVGDSLLLPS